MTHDRVPAMSPTGFERMDFANMFSFPSLKSQMAAFDSEANGQLRMLRKTYLQSFANCTDRTTFGVKIPKTPGRAWN